MFKYKTIIPYTISILIHALILISIIYFIYDYQKLPGDKHLEFGIIEMHKQNDTYAKNNESKSTKPKEREKISVRNQHRRNESEKSMNSQNLQIAAIKQNMLPIESENKNESIKTGEKSINTSYTIYMDEFQNNGTDKLAFPDYNINPKPKYPMIARKRGYEGVVLLKVLVLESGEVGDLVLQKDSGYQVLNEAAVEAVQNWIFIPAKKNGKAMSSWVTVPVKFQLESG